MPRSLPAAIYWMQVRMLAETSDTWSEGAINWNTAPQNDLLSTGVTGTTQQLASYFHFDASTLPAVNSVVSLTLTASSINTNRGANNQVTLALVPAASESGAMIWAAREHATLPPPTLEVTTASNQPKRPGFLTATPGAGSSLVLNWFDGLSDETGFELQRRAANGDWALLQTLAPNATTFTDTTALPGVIYEYRIRATNASGSSSWASTTSVQYSGAVALTGAINSPDGNVFYRSPAIGANVHVPTNLRYLGAAVPFVTGQTLGSTIRNNYTGWLGMKFTVGSSPIVVRELARWVVSTSGSGTHTVKLVDAVTRQTLPNGTASISTAGAPVGFKYGTLPAPVTLAANTSYFLASQETLGGDQWYEGDSVLTYNSSAATVVNAANSPNGISFSNVFSAGNCYVPLSFTYSSAPLPAVLSHSMTVLRNDITGWLGMEFTVEMPRSSRLNSGAGSPRGIVAPTRSGSLRRPPVPPLAPSPSTPRARPPETSNTRPSLPPLPSPPTLATTSSVRKQRAATLGMISASPPRVSPLATSNGSSPMACQWTPAAAVAPRPRRRATASPTCSRYALGLNPNVSGNGGRPELRPDQQCRHRLPDLHLYAARTSADRHHLLGGSQLRPRRGQLAGHRPHGNQQHGQWRPPHHHRPRRDPDDQRQPAVHTIEGDPAVRRASSSFSGTSMG